MGGTLHQDMTAPGTTHPPISDVPTEVMGLRHPIVVDADSRLAKAYGGDIERVVNSIHHQAIDRLAPGFRASPGHPTVSSRRSSRRIVPAGSSQCSGIRRRSTAKVTTYCSITSSTR